MVPTAAGERLAKSAQEILVALASAERAIQLFAGGERGRLRVTVAGYASYRWLPSVLQRYRRLHPRIEVQIPVNAPQGARTTILLDDGSQPGAGAAVAQTLAEADQYMPSSGGVADSCRCSSAWPSCW